MAPIYPRLDYSSDIKREIESDVKKLLERVRDSVAYWRSLDHFLSDEEAPLVSHIELGYTRNMHLGKDLFSDKDYICGLPIKISYDNPLSITVVARNVEFEVEVWNGEEDADNDAKGEYVTEYVTKDLSETIT